MSLFKRRDLAWRSLRLEVVDVSLNSIPKLSALDRRTIVRYALMRVAVYYSREWGVEKVSSGCLVRFSYPG